MISAVRQYSWLIRLFGRIPIGISMPSFWLGLLLMLTFSLRLRWLPLSGMGYLHNGLGDVLRHLIMPACTLGFGMAALLARVTRSSMLEVLGQDYIRTARAKGLHDKLVVYRHALRNAFIPILTVSGMQFGYLWAARYHRDYLQLAGHRPSGSQLHHEQGPGRCTRHCPGFTLIFILINLLVDILYAAIDPRIQYD